MNRKIASTVSVLAVATSLCAQNAVRPLLANKEDSIYYARTYCLDNNALTGNKELAKHKEAFINSLNTTYKGIEKGLSEKDIKEELNKDTANKEAVETGFVIATICHLEKNRGPIFIQSLNDRLNGESSIGWKKEDMLQFLKKEEALKEKEKNDKEQRWSNLFKEGYIELKDKNEGISSEIEYTGRGVFMKVKKDGKGDKARLKDIVTIAYDMKLPDGKNIGHGNAVEVTPDYVINGLCAALINLKEGAEATIVIPEGLGYRDDIIFEDPLKADRDKVENKGLIMDIKILKIKKKY